MPHRLVRLFRSLLALALAGCLAPSPHPFGETVTVRVTAADTTRSLRFALDVRGGEAELRAPQMRGWATDARLLASTPAEVTFEAGTTAASFRALGGGRLDVTAVSRRGRLWADGDRVRLVSTGAGLSIRDY